MPAAKVSEAAKTCWSELSGTAMVWPRYRSPRTRRPTARVHAGGGCGGRVADDRAAEEHSPAEAGRGVARAGEVDDEEPDQPADHGKSDGKGEDLQRDHSGPAHARIVRRARESFRNRSYSSSSQYSTAGPGLANMMSSSLASFARTFPVSRYSMTSPGDIEESMRTRIGEPVRLMI